MNIERWVAGRVNTWHRLEELLVRIEQSGLKSLNRQQLRELGRLYKSASADLSRLRAFNIAYDLTNYLNSLVVKAHNQVYQRHCSRWKHISHFLWVSFPRLVRENILFVALASAVFWLPAFVCWEYVLHDEQFAHFELAKGHPLVAEQMWNMIENHKMWTDSLEEYGPLASSAIATNNLRVALMAFALGITFGLGTIWVLATNGMMLGAVFGACSVHGMDFRLVSFVAPHGVLELSAIFICGGAGLIIGKALLFQGQSTRLTALKSSTKRAMGLFLGCIPLLLLAGLIEGFISPRIDVRWEVKFVIGAASLIFLLIYLFFPRSKSGSQQNPDLDTIS